MISNLDFPNFDDGEEGHRDPFDRQMRDFQREMEVKKGEWKERMEAMFKKYINWQWNNHWGAKIDGSY